MFNPPLEVVYIRVGCGDRMPRSRSPARRTVGVRVAGIYIAPASAAPMESLLSATLIEGRGIEGDRYALHTGTYSALRASAKAPGEREPGRQLTMVSADGVEASLKRAGVKPPPCLEFRRNIVLKGISAEELLSAVGRTVEVGDARVFVHRHCVPCLYNERKAGCPGMMEAVWMASGVSCEVVAGGTLRVGDPLAMVGEKDASRVDAGIHPAGYYLPPSKRTSAMVREARERQAAARAALEASGGREGVERAERAYASVGLTFWPEQTGTASGRPRFPSGWRAAAAMALLACLAWAALAARPELAHRFAPPPRAQTRDSPRLPPSPRMPPPLPAPTLPPDDDDDEILCDCGWTRVEGQSCVETAGKEGFACWSDCCGT